MYLSPRSARATPPRSWRSCACSSSERPPRAHPLPCPLLRGGGRWRERGGEGGTPALPTLRGGGRWREREGRRPCQRPQWWGWETHAGPAPRAERGAAAGRRLEESRLSEILCNHWAAVLPRPPLPLAERGLSETAPPHQVAAAAAAANFNSVETFLDARRPGGGEAGEEWGAAGAALAQEVAAAARVEILAAAAEYAPRPPSLPLSLFRFRGGPLPPPRPQPHRRRAPPRPFPLPPVLTGHVLSLSPY